MSESYALSIKLLNIIIRSIDQSLGLAGALPGVVGWHGKAAGLSGMPDLIWIAGEVADLAEITCQYNLTKSS
jgi:hypothetical protein